MTAILKTAIILNGTRQGLSMKNSEIIKSGGFTEEDFQIIIC